MGAPGSPVTATLIYDPEEANAVSTDCTVSLVPCFGGDEDSAFYTDAVASLEIALGVVTFSSRSTDAIVVDSDFDGVSFGAGLASVSIANVPIFGFFGTSGLTFVDETASALTSAALQGVDGVLGDFEILDTELYLLNPFVGLQTLVIDWDEDTLVVDGGGAVSTPLPIGAWLMLGPLAAWTVSRRRWSARA